MPSKEHDDEHEGASLIMSVMDHVTSGRGKLTADDDNNIITTEVQRDDPAEHYHDAPTERAAATPDGELPAWLAPPVWLGGLNSAVILVYAPAAMCLDSIPMECAADNLRQGRWIVFVHQNVVPYGLYAVMVWWGFHSIRQAVLPAEGARLARQLGYRHRVQLPEGVWVAL